MEPELKGKKNILLIDDEEDVLKVVGRRLEKAGYNIWTAASAKDGLAVLETKNPDLILLDISMPEVDGIEMCKRIKERPEMATVPIVFFTALDSVEDKVRGFKLKVNDYITKPINYQELLARIESILSINEHYIDISVRDKLTGLYNYNYFDKQFSHIFDIAKRYGRIFSLVIVDINNFKRINDEYGHLCGNFFLEKVAENLRTSFRKVDIIARYGGDEFTVILPETTYEQADKLIERIRKNIGILELDYEGKKVGTSLSFGFAAYSEKMEDKEVLFYAADQGMYRDKKKKRVADEESIDNRR
ncbi:MAG: diguanylate cyclase [Candidatus Omnitrophota bacterium]